MVRLNSDLVYVTEVDAQAVVLDAAATTYSTANAAGTLIMEQLGIGTTLDALVSLVVERFEVDPATARRDCVDFLAELEDRGWLIEPDEGPSAATRS